MRPIDNGDPNPFRGIESDRARECESAIGVDVVRVKLDRLTVGERQILARKIFDRPDGVQSETTFGIDVLEVGVESGIHCVLRRQRMRRACSVRDRALAIPIF